MKLGEVRRSQVVSTYGPGSLIPVDEHSFIVAGIDSWEVDEIDLEIREARLERHLGVGRFVLPPSSDDNVKGRDIPVLRFPRQYSCSSCHHLGLYKDIAAIDGACAACGCRLVTSRFVVVCGNGHIDEFPYHRWAHRGRAASDAQIHRLTLRSEGKSAALSDIVVECSCGAQRDLGGALGKNALKGVIVCSGLRPWLRDKDPEKCELQPRGVQRGASNVWQALTFSTISIPPWSDLAYRVVERFWDIIGGIPPEILTGVLESMVRQRGIDVGIDELLAVVEERRRLADAPPPTVADLRLQEHEALLRGRADVGTPQDFVCIKPSPEEVVPAPIAELRLVTRLREVRALTGFYRLNPPRPPDGRDAPLARARLNWLPAIEVSGEAVFIGLDLDVVRAWEGQPDMTARIARLRGGDASNSEPVPDDRVPTPRRMLVHTLAHALIDQWSLDCGYPAASLRERLYIGDDMAGLLIYTATSDSAGSLGGVVGMATGGQFEKSLHEALHRASWCSNDPLCMESGAGGVDSLNLGACHACLLLPETSCELGNTLLDRGVLIGAPDGCRGFFDDLLKN